MSSSAETITGVLSTAVVLSSIAGLVVAVMNLRNKDISCTVRSLCYAYIMFFVVSILSLIGVAGALFKGTEAGATAGSTLVAFSSVGMFVTSALLLYYSSSFGDKKLRNTNYVVFGILVVLSVLNTTFALSNGKSLLSGQPASKFYNYVTSQLGSGATTGSTMSAGRGYTYARTPRV